jgi:hypothetical protein
MEGVVADRACTSSNQDVHDAFEAQVSQREKNIRQNSGDSHSISDSDNSDSDFDWESGMNKMLQRPVFGDKKDSANVALVAVCQQCLALCVTRQVRS